VKRYGGRYHGWVANAQAPAIFARHLVTIHVPRRFYTQTLPGIPTIRPFEALACGIPLLSAPWQDSEHLFRVGEDFLMVQNEAEMTDALRRIASDPELRRSLVANGLETIRARHTCAHRAEELLTIVNGLRSSRAKSRGAGTTAEQHPSTSLGVSGQSSGREFPHEDRLLRLQSALLLLEWCRDLLSRAAARPCQPRL
jgi:hypothetical protein